MDFCGNAPSLTRPHNFVDGCHFQQLSHDRALAVSTDNREHLSEIGVDVLVYGCEIPRIAGVGITAVEEDKYRPWVRLDDRLHVGWRGQRKGDIGITETSVELDWMKVLLRSDMV